MRPETTYWHPYSDMGSVRHSELVLERGEDVWVGDADGNRCFDATAGRWYANVSHGRPEIRAAVAAQMERLEACSAFFDLANRPVLELAAARPERAPMPAKVFEAAEQSLQEGGQEIAVEQNLRESHLVGASDWAVL